jgi:hypothetical protein
MKRIELTVAVLTATIPCGLGRCGTFGFGVIHFGTKRRPHRYNRRNSEGVTPETSRGWQLAKRFERDPLLSQHSRQVHQKNAPRVGFEPTASR